MHREVFPQWQPPPAHVKLSECRIDIWLIRLASQRSGSASDGKADTDASGGQRMAAHRAMREILGRYLGCEPNDRDFAVHPGGKPYFSRPDEKIEFNLSHSRDIALLAVASGLAVGIDVEAHRHIDDPLRLARRVMPGADTTELASLTGAARLDRFLMLWTRLEARQKAVGQGIFAQHADPSLLSNFSFRPDAGLYASLSASPATTGLELGFFNYEPV